jgi:two-component system, OmpR family, response regulator
MEMRKKIIIVENDPNFGSMLESYLSISGFEATLAQNGMEGFEKFKKNKYDVCIIDVTMTHKDAYTLTKEIRGKGIEIPIVFLLGRGMAGDVLNGYKSESDDFLRKPFDFDFLLAKINAVIEYKALESKRKANNPEFKIGEFNFNTELRLLSLSGTEPIKLSPKENKLLKMLALHENNLMTRQLALIKIWRDDDYYASRCMDVYIARLRKHLRADRSVEILNIPNKGFKLVTESIMA